MTYTLFLFQIISFKKYFYVSLGNNFFTVLWRPLIVAAPGQLSSLPPPLKSGPGARFTKYLTTILRLSYNNAKVTTYDGRLFYKTSHEGRKAFLRYDSFAKL